MRTSNCCPQIRFCALNCDLQIRCTIPFLWSNFEPCFFCHMLCKLQILAYKIGFVHAPNCDVQISVFKLWSINSVFQIPFSHVLYPVSHLDYSGLGSRVFRQKKTEIKMADEKYSEVIKLLRRAESLLSSIPSPNKQLLRKRGVWRQNNGHAVCSQFSITVCTIYSV